MQLSSTTTTIHSFNVQNSQSLNKIDLKYQINNLDTEVMSRDRYR